ncbi:MAG: aminotransferase class I/II-fold pyridoxal phosphate-dependent enzyme [Anaerolineales bacterium]|nr:aminotransferase class I/II-fold pyridoxal phosphate-dependent enzyme [Anaerolineales bacterium]
MFSPSSRMQRISTYFFAELDQKIARMKQDGQEIIRLDIGSPDLAPHPSVVEALYESAKRTDSHGYQPHCGTPTYRQAWADMYNKRFGVKIDPEKEIVPLVGSKEGLFHFCQMMISPGDLVIIPTPYYPTYVRGTNFAGGTPYFVSSREEDGYLLDLDSIPKNIAEKAKILWINYPNNPTGACADLEYLKKVVAFARNHNILICADMPYTQVYYTDDPPPTLLQVEGSMDVAVEFNSLSKSHNMAGWRAGAMIGKPEILKEYLRLKSNLDSGQFLPIMEAATKAMQLDEGWIKERNLIYKKRRDFLVDGIRNMGLDVKTPEAALYLWIPVPNNYSSMQFCVDLLDQAGVSVSPGTIFGEEGEGYFRITLCQPEDMLLRAVEKIKKQWNKQ